MDPHDPDAHPVPGADRDVVAEMDALLGARRHADAARVGLDALAAMTPGDPGEFGILGVLYHQILARKRTKKLALAAIPAWESRIPAWEARYGQDHAIVTSSLGDLARLYRFAGQREREATTLARVLAAVERRLGPDCPAAPTYAFELAAALAALGRPAEAEVHFLRALTHEARHGIPNGATAVAICEALAMLHRGQGDRERADGYDARAAAARATWTRR